MDYNILCIRDAPHLSAAAAQWFHEKWGVPREEYLCSMDQCLAKRRAVPQWYVVTLEGDIVGGAGVIQNDFHNRKDLSPNLCALYVEQPHRGQGIAGRLLDYVCADMKQYGIEVLYLITDHTSFYERYGWEFLCMVQGDGDENPSRMYIHKAP